MTHQTKTIWQDTTTKSNQIKLLEEKLFQKENEIEILNCNDQNKSDGIRALTDKINELVLEIERLKNNWIYLPFFFDIYSFDSCML